MLYSKGSRNTYVPTVLKNIYNDSLFSAEMKSRTRRSRLVTMFHYICYNVRTGFTSFTYFCLVYTEFHHPWGNENSNSHPLDSTVCYHPKRSSVRKFRNKFHHQLVGYLWWWTLKLKHSSSEFFPWDDFVVWSIDLEIAVSLWICFLLHFVEHKNVTPYRVWYRLLWLNIVLQDIFSLNGKINLTLSQSTK